MGVYATAIFDIRNIGKVSHGDKGRIGAAAAQTTNLVNAASKSSIEPLQKGATTILNYVDDAGNLVGVTNAASKVTSVASKAVNPLLCVASGMRVLNDEDQYAALIEETCAMGTMFAGELSRLSGQCVADRCVRLSRWAGPFADSGRFVRNQHGRRGTSRRLLRSSDVGERVAQIRKCGTGDNERLERNDFRPERLSLPGGYPKSRIRIYEQQRFGMARCSIPAGWVRSR